MSHIGHSIIGKQVYGKNSSKSVKIRQRLRLYPQIQWTSIHIYKLGLYHPKSKKYVEFKSDLPKDMRILIGEFEEMTNK